LGKSFKWTFSMSRSSSFNKGFTLTEVLVTLSIMVIILTVTLLNQSSYTEKVGLANLADQISLSLSQAQSYGIAVRELTPGSQDFSNAYGMSFSKLPGASASTYIFFADRNGNASYDGDWTCPIGGASECLEKVDMRQGNLINSICIIEEDGSEDCATPQRVDVSFVRPKTEAQMAVFNSSGTLIDTSNAQGIKVSLRSPNSFERLVVVYKVGQISALEPVYDYQYPSPAYNYPSPQAYLTPYVYPSPPTVYDLTVTKLGTGTGTVTGAGINCGSTCTGAFVSGSQVTLTATPDSSNIFSGWTGNCTGTGTCPLTMDGSKIARATFTKVGPTVTAFDVQPRSTLARTTATFTATDATAGAYLSSADLRRAVKGANCTTTNISGCSWSTVSTSKASTLSTLTNSVGVSISSNNITKNNAEGWNAQAVSSETIASGDGFVEFTAGETTSYKMAGLGYSDTNASYTDIEYAVYMAIGGALYIYEIDAVGNSVSSGSFGYYAAGDVFKVAIESGVVKYYKNGTLIYTSTYSPTSGAGSQHSYPYRFDSSLYTAAGSSITNVKVSSNTLNSWTGNMKDTPSGTYIYGLKVYDKNPSGANMGSEPARIEVTSDGLSNSFAPDAGGTLPNNLAGYWKLNETSGSRADSKGVTPLTDNNTVTYNPGKKGNAAQFAQANFEFLSSADNATISTGDINYSLAGWVYLDSKAGYGTLAAKYLVGTNREYWLGYDGAVDRITWYVYDAAGTRIGFVASNNFGAMSAGVWYFFYAEHNATNNTVSISVNNSALDTAATTGPAGDSTATFFLGADSPSSSVDALNGRLDEVGYWKRALTAQERTDLYNGGSGNTYTP
jgi:prepilin-type N-terminal cleavage/methylation domain-containing protein